MSSHVVLSVRGLVKRFGSVTAVNNVSFDVRSGEVFCIVGPNGAGKTTTLRIIAGIVEPDAGEIVAFNGRVQWGSIEYRKLLSYLPEDAGVYRNLTGLDYFRFIAAMYFEDPASIGEAVERGVKLSGLGARVRDKAWDYSRGMKRRLLLAAALMVNPKLAILDEPTTGLDVTHAVEMRRTIVDYVKTTGSSAIVSSHNMLEVSYVCD
ncbi:MAG: ABC transporter ATP-binding protein, partial [Thermoprotei archaeon]|nr:ABC transporter ATP-binding protein [Thermoprotei archaeon]